ncbi:P2R1A-PPP2R2A-interacting phosphatase regulator 1 [Atheta coriaria]|uniref:P2R1A-PPP2R2A-interacting phosphatase regulator 1 n=1 Tax=Dalotia coriaria TaxID=877792 RepID=UPI0031F3AC07
MTSSQNIAMDVDSPAGTLKRCSSAPMINENSTTGMTTSPPASTSSRETSIINLLGSSNQSRPRRFSASSSPLSAGSPKITPRISQLRQEECVDVNNSRELAHERETHHTMQISQSWEDLRLVSDNQKPNKMSPLQLNLPPFGNYCTSPSPSRLPYCTSPGILSPTRTSLTRRSASPVFRPSTLGAKRKLDNKLDDKLDFHSSPRAKRMSYGNDRGGGLLTTSSPLPGSLSSIGTPESISSADSPSFQFRMMDSPSPSRPGVEQMVVSKQDHEMSEPPS